MVERRVTGQGRGVRVQQCTTCGRSGIPYHVATRRAQERRQERLVRSARHVLEGPFVPVVPPPRRRNGWTPDEALPRGERE